MVQVVHLPLIKSLRRLALEFLIESFFLVSDARWSFSFLFFLRCSSSFGSCYRSLIAVSYPVHLAFIRRH